MEVIMKARKKDPEQDYNGLQNAILFATNDKIDPDNPSSENSEDQLTDFESNEDLKHPSESNYTGNGR